MDVNWDAVAAIATLIALGFAYNAVAAARDGVLATRDAVLQARDAVVEARETRRADLLLQFSEGYTNLHDSLRLLGARQTTHGSIGAMKDAYVAAVKPVESSTSDTEWNDARRRVSKFFLKAKILCEARLFDPELFAKTVEKAGFDLYVEVVGPLDEVHNHRVLARDDFDDSTWRFFTEFRRQHFGVTS